MLTAPLFVFVISFVMVCFFIKKTIYIAHTKQLFDEPTESRKVHMVRIPNLGGAAIFGSFFLISTLSPVLFAIPHLNFIALSALLLFITGLADDLNAIAAWKKMTVQFVVALLVSLAAGYRLESLYDLFGIHTLGVTASIVLSAGFIVFVVNAFNLIDGIDCLAAGTGLLASSIFLIYFHMAGAKDLEWMCITLAGGLAAFIWFNKTPAKIFLGDSGSTFIGFLMAFFSISLINLPSHTAAELPFFSKPGFLIIMVVAILAVPVFDTVRVFYTRISMRKNPFVADRNHIHHRLLGLGFSHMQSTSILLIINISLVLLALVCREWKSEIVFGLIVLMAAGLNWLLSFAIRTRAKQITTRRTDIKNPAAKTGKVKILFNSRTTMK